MINEDFKKRVVRNALFLFYARVWFLAVGLFLTPYLLSKLGNDEYGIWVLIGVFVGYVGIADFGLRTSFVKFVAEYHARNDQRSVNGVFSTGLTVYFVLAFIILAAAYPSLSSILDFFTIPPDMEEKARFVLELGIIALVWGNFILVYQSVIDGLQRMDISTGISIFLSIVYTLGCIVVLELGFGIRGLAVNQLVTHSISTVVTIFFAYRFYPGLRFDLKSAREHFATLFRYAINLQICNISGLINLHFDKLVVNRFVDASHVAFYEIGSRLPLTLRGFPMVVLSPLMPATSELEIRQGKAAVYEVFSRVSKYLSVVAVPVFTGAVVTAQPFIEAWVGQGYNSSAVVLRVLSIGYCFYTIAGPSSHMLSGMGRPDYLRNAESLNLFLNVLCSILLISQYGFYGAPVGTTIAMSVTAFYYLWVFHRFMERPLFAFLKSTLLKPALSAVVSGLIGVGIISSLTPYASAGRLGAFLVVFAAGSTFVVSYVFLILKLSHLDGRDIALLRDHIPFIRS